MLTREQRDAVFEGIPDKAGNMHVKKFKAESGPNKETNFPIMIVKFLTEGNRKEFYFTPVGEVRYGTGTIGTIYGHIDKATVSVAIDSIDVGMLHDIVEDFYRELWATELYLPRSTSKHVWFRGVHDPVYLPTWYNNDNRKWIHRCVIDIAIEYEVRWERKVPTMLSFSKQVEAVGGAGTIVDLIICASGSYTMDALFISGTPYIKYPIDVILELPSRSRSYSMSTKII